jgi:hypothetical protein
MELTLNELLDLWKTWKADLDLQRLRFGQYVCNRKLKPGYTWAECFYANSEDAFEILLQLLEENRFTGKQIRQENYNGTEKYCYRHC